MAQGQRLLALTSLALVGCMSSSYQERDAGPPVSREEIGPPLDEMPSVEAHVFREPGALWLWVVHARRCKRAMIARTPRVGEDESSPSAFTTVTAGALVGLGYLSLFSSDVDPKGTSVATLLPIAIGGSIYGIAAASAGTTERKLPDRVDARPLRPVSCHARPIPHASVVVSRAGAQVQTTTDASGSAIIRESLAGKLSVEVEGVRATIIEERPR